MMRCTKFMMYASVFFCLLSSESAAQNSLELENLQRLINLKEAERNNPLVSVKKPPPGLCTDLYFPQDGAYDAFESDDDFVEDTVNYYRKLIWNLDTSGIPQDDSLLGDYLDPDILNDLLNNGGSITNPSTDLVTPPGSLPTPPAKLDLTDPDFSSKATSAVNQMIGLLSTWNGRVDEVSPQNSVNARVVGTSSLTRSSDCLTGGWDSGDCAEALATALAHPSYADVTVAYPSSNITNTTVLARIDRSEFESTISSTCPGTGFSINISEFWSTGHISVQPENGYQGTFEVFVRISGTVSPNGNLSNPFGLPLDGDYHHIGSVSAGGGTISIPNSEPDDGYICNGGNLAQQGGWSISSDGGAFSLNDDDVLVIAFANPSAQGPGEVGGCSPDMSAFDDAVPNNVGELSDGSVQIPGCDEGEIVGDNPESDEPVSYATGHKHESATDLTVSVTGPDFVLQRDYLSDPDVFASNGNGVLLGQGWASDAFCKLEFGSGNPPSTLDLVGWPQHETTRFVYNSTDDEWSTGGPTPQIISEGTVRLDRTPQSPPVNTYILEEPGKWKMAFYKTGTLAGYPLLWTDYYGNRRTFQYWVDGTKTRLRAVYLNGAPNLNISDAIVQFNWIESGSNAGLLDQLEVLRITSEGTYVTTQSVDYVYGLEVPQIHSDVGADDDLVAVIRKQLMDDAPGTSPLMHSWVTHYRYHDGNAASSDPDERYEVEGEPHQLKAVLDSQQIEYVAQRRVETGVLIADPEDALLETSDWLLTQSDSAAVGTWDMETYEVFDAASKIISYSSISPHQVDTQYSQTACGCGGGATQGQKIEYEYAYYTWPGTGAPDGRSVKESIYRWESNSWVLHRTDYTDLEERNGGIPYTKYRVVQEASSPNRTWISEFVYDTNGNLEEELSPGWHALSTYTAAVDTLSSPSLGGPSSAGGLRHKFVYNSVNRLVEKLVWDESLGASGDFSLVEKLSYNPTRKWLVDSRELYSLASSSGGLADSEIQRTNYTYYFHNSNSAVYGFAYNNQFDSLNDNSAVSAVRTLVERELDTENGPDGTGNYDTFILFDKYGQVEWQVLEDTSMTYYGYDAASGRQSLMIRNANREDPANGLGAAYSSNNYGTLVSTTDDDSWAQGVGDELVSRSSYDQLGRRVSSTGPGGNTYVTRRDRAETDFDPLLSDPREGILYMRVVEFPHSLNSEAAPYLYDGPLQFTWVDAGGEVIEQRSVTLDDSSSVFQPMASPPVYSIESSSSGFDTGTIVRSVFGHTLTGLLSQSDQWHDVNDPDAKYTMAFGHDSLGRLTYILDRVGTGTHFDHDVLDRVVSIKLESTLDVHPDEAGPSSATLVEERYYDADQSLSSPVQGVGNGLVTVEVAHTGENPGTRTTKRYFDSRDRNTGVVHEELPTTSMRYDNLDRVIETAVHSTLDSGGLPRLTTDDTDRGRYEIVSYSQRGLVYLTEQAIDPLASVPEMLRSDQWFDSRGRVIASRSPSAPMTKTVYDAHSRVVTGYTTDHGDTVTGSGSYADASSIDDNIDGDRVIEQVDYAYDDQNRLLHTTQSLRPHTDTSSTGALTSSNSVRMHTAFIFDAADRVIATANYGTGVDGAFEAGLSDPSFPTDPEDIAGLDTPGALVSKTEYNRRGIVSANVDAEGMRVETLYDDLARTVATIENATNVDASDITWYSSMSEPLDDRWEVTYTSLAYQSPEEDRITSFVYNGESNIVKRVAHFPKQSGGSNTVEGVQITEYEYGVIRPPEPLTAQDNLITSGSLLRAVLYPDESTGQPIRAQGNPDYEKYSIEYDYNQLGEVIRKRDQNLTQISYEFDGLGRLIANTVESYNSFIDDSILRIETEYDDLGRLLRSTSRDGDTGTSTVVNQVEFSYTPLWQIKEIWQEHDGVVDSSTPTTPKVEYVWDTSASSNYTRLENVVYPSQDAATNPTVEIVYGASDTINNRISRESSRLVETLGDHGSTHDPIVSYEYLGLGTPARVTYVAATGIQLSRVHVAEGTENQTGGYPGFDRFGRVKQQLWVDSAFGPHGSIPDIPAIPPIVERSYYYIDTAPDPEVEISYDNVHNRLIDHDSRPGTRLADRNFNFVYDSLHRLETAVRSDYNFSLSSETKHWELDSFGNWVKEYNDSDTDGAYSVNDDRLNNWSHNQANELTEGVFSIPTTPLPAYSLPNLFQHDDAGNMRRSDQSTNDDHRYNEYIYDAWNRLVQVIDHRSEYVQHTILESEYNGLGWRIARLSDTSDSSHDGLDESRLYFYSGDWQLLEEHVDIDLDDTPDRIGQQFWGARHLNEAVAKRINWDPSVNGPDYTDGIFFYITDVLYSPLAIVRDNGDLVNRLFYRAYGYAEQSWASDVNQDGQSDYFDLNILNTMSTTAPHPIEGSVYNVDGDLDRDGGMGATNDVNLWVEQGNAITLPSGWIDASDPNHMGAGKRPFADNSIGYAGAVFDPSIGMYQMRNRYYSPEWGRFIHRDPLGYVDGQSVYEYVQSNPISLFDTYGTESADYWQDLASRWLYSKIDRQHSSTTGYLPVAPPGGTPRSGNDIAWQSYRISLNSGISSRYQALYSMNPEAFKWAGMAHHASVFVGRKMASSTYADILLTHETDRSTLALLSSELYHRTSANEYSGEMFGLLTSGNLAVYNDIVWQHLAYQFGGIAEMRDLASQGTLSDDLLAAWEAIHYGLENDDPNCIWAGNEALLKHEQLVTLQSAVYNANPIAWYGLSSLRFGNASAIRSPVPGGSGFHSSVPGGNIGNPADRWRWISGTMLPGYRAWLNNNPSNQSE